MAKAKKKKEFYVVDDDPFFVELLTALLEGAGHSVSSNTSSPAALAEIIERKPFCVLFDIMMPEMDGLELCTQIRSREELAATKLIAVSAKSYEFDRKRILDFGADGFIRKPVSSDTFLDQVGRIVDDMIEVTFHGVRGTLPVPGKHSLKYGGNTSCVTLEFSKGQFFIFDAGSGIKALSDRLLAEKRVPIEAKIFISHPHWDHINALPFFVPLYIPGNDFEICGASHGDRDMRQLISAQMDGIYFPITIKEFGSRVYFTNLKEETVERNGITVKTMFLNHPGHCLGYRVEYRGRSVCYVTDNELYLDSNPLFNRTYVDKLVDFVRATDILITDATYSDDGYLEKVGWGHSSVGQVAALAHQAEVKTLYLFHHNPDQTDTDIDAKLKSARTRLTALGSKTVCKAPVEGLTVKI